MISPQNSVIISLLSGVGLLAVVSIAPVKSTDSSVPMLPIEKEQILKEGKSNIESSLIKEKEIVYSSKKAPAQAEFHLNASISETLRLEATSFEETFLPSQSEGRISSIRSQTDWDLYENRIGEKKIFFQKDGLVMRAIGNPSSLYPQFSRRDFSPVDRYTSRRGDAYELQYAITPNIGAVVQGSSYDQIGDDRSRGQRNVAMAGISLQSGDLFQAKVLTGDSSYVNSSPSTTSFNPLNPNRPNDISRRERDDVKQLYEWQANFTPSDYFKLQTSVYNQRTENSLNMSSPDGGKVSVFMGGKKVQLNVRYNYLTNRNGAGNQNGQIFNPSQDLASLGVIVFLDQSQRYSIYVGNNFYNVLNDPVNQVKDASGKSPSTFTASFRGKNPASTKSSFFFNVQNQFYKDGALLGVPGMTPLGIVQGKSFYEYATSLGVDVAF
ncbi:hypothetical protein [Leptospira ognonensis]|nr:hypothetical protein [Leptospira ognonensis]